MDNQQPQPEEAFIINRKQLEELLHFFMNAAMPRVQSDPYVQLLGKVSMQKVNAIKTAAPEKE